MSENHVICSTRFNKHVTQIFFLYFSNIFIFLTGIALNVLRKRYYEEKYYVIIGKSGSDF